MLIEEIGDPQPRLGGGGGVWPVEFDESRFLLHRGWGLLVLGIAVVFPDGGLGWWFIL